MEKINMDQINQGMIAIDPPANYNFLKQPEQEKPSDHSSGVGDQQVRHMADRIRELTNDNTKLLHSINSLLLTREDLIKTIDDLKKENTKLSYQLNEALVSKTERLAGDSRFHVILQSLANLHAKKSMDYGNVHHDVFANFRSSEEMGIPAWKGAMVRAGDKIKRIWKFAKDGWLENESVEDSMLDLASYSIISLILFRETTLDGNEEKNQSFINRGKESAGSQVSPIGVQDSKKSLLSPQSCS